MNLLIIDNYDSFTYNLAQAFGAIGVDVKVCRNDQISVDEVQTMRPDRIVISPGPGRPDDGGISLDVLAQVSSEIPTLGVCLGHQCIGQAFGGLIIRAGNLMHGKTSEILHDGHAIFRDVPSPFVATRYHSLIVENQIPDSLEVIARTAEGEIMGLRHRGLPIVGVQFHPESILTEYGPKIMKNFVEGGL